MEGDGWKDGWMMIETRRVTTRSRKSGKKRHETMGGWMDVWVKW
jgi:hypothetical protein